jgi:hypothetical protein
MLRSLIFGLLALLLAALPLAAEELVMVEQPGCAYCMEWDRTIAPIYPKTAEGKFAPLRRAQLRDGPPAGVEFDRAVVFTPTFILVKGGKELARIEGYPGEDFFWGLLGRMLDQHTNFNPQGDRPAKS